MLIELGILLIVILICITLWIGLQYFGIFEEIEVSAGPPPYQFGGRLMAYKKQKGCYSDSSALFTEVCSIVPGLDTIGIYLDDPNKHHKNKCRYIVGALLDQQQEDQQLEDQKQLLISKGFICGQLPAVDHVVYSLFPFKGIISVVIAIRRVYPRIRSFIAEHNLCAHPGIEVYSGNEIYFMFPLAKQDQFYQLYGTVDPNDETDDNSNAEEDEIEETEDEVLNSPQSNDNKCFEEVSSVRLRSSKGSKQSSTSSSFEELIAEDNTKES